MKRPLILVALSLVAIFATAPTAQSQERGLSKLTRSDARYYMTVALDRRFRSYGSGYAYRLKCVKRYTRNRIRCLKIQWVVGDIEYKGTGMIWLTHRGRIWNYSYRIRRRDTYCLWTGGTHCSRMFVVK
jgi:hypothetical protein